MKIINYFKRNRIIRGLFIGSHSLFGYSRKSFGYLSKGTCFSPHLIIINPKNIYIYADTNIGPAYISALNAKFIIKKGCAIGPHIEVHTGNHARISGKFVGNIVEKDKPQGYDEDIVVEEDVWVGCNVTLLAGVTIGRGTTVAAGAVVNKSMPPYCICGGVPAKFIKFYWTIDQILEHEEKLYPEKERYTREQLEEIFEKWGSK